jgi:hypothetical protein
MTAPIQIALEASAFAVRQENNKRLERKKLKKSLFADGMTVSGKDL